MTQLNQDSGVRPNKCTTVMKKMQSKTARKDKELGSNKLVLNQKDES